MSDSFQFSSLKTCLICGMKVAAVNDFLECKGCVIRRLPKRRRAVFDAVRRLGPATGGEIAEACGLASPTAVFYHLRILSEEELVLWEPGLHRTIRENVAWPARGKAS